MLKFQHIRIECKTATITSSFAMFLRNKSKERRKRKQFLLACLSSLLFIYAFCVEWEILEMKLSFLHYYYFLSATWYIYFVTFKFLLFVRKGSGCNKMKRFSFLSLRMYLLTLFYDACRFSIQNTTIGGFVNNNRRHHRSIAIIFIYRMPYFFLHNDHAKNLFL